MHLIMPEIIKVPKFIEINTRRYGKVDACFTGPSMWGYVYSGGNQPCYFKLIPIEDVYDLEKKVRIKNQIDTPRYSNIAHIIEVDEIMLENESAFYCICYEVSGKSFVDLINSADHKERLACLGKLLASMSKWWGNVYEGFLPMPADFVIAGGELVLMGIPCLSDLPRMVTLFEEPERILYLAPEIICGNDDLNTRRNIDIYACGIIAMKCIFNFCIELDPATLINKIANSSLLERDNLTFRLPYRLEKISFLKEYINEIQKAVHADKITRSTVDLLKTAGVVRSITVDMEPLKVVDILRQTKKFREALDFLEDAMLNIPNNEFLFLAAKIAYDDLKLIFEAIDYYERAINRFPDNKEAYSRQLSIVLKELPDLMEKRNISNDRLDAIIQRNFFMLTKYFQKDYLIDTVNYFILSRNYDTAAKALFPHLYENDVFLWWEFSRTLLYTTILAYQGRIKESSDFLKMIRHKLADINSLPANDPRKFSQTDIDKYAKKILELDCLINRVRDQA